ncbi:MAG: CheR family methyltransferase [Terriglobus sp.]
MTHDASALIAAHLLSSLGMNASVLEASHLRRAIRRRMEAVGLRSPEWYAEHYRTSPAEQEQLAEEIYIHETCFFRDRAVFTESVMWVKAWLAVNDGPVKILSAPCSTGEEPYSLAALLLAEGVPVERFSIHAVDVSGNALAHAEHAVYRGLSLRNIASPAQEGFLESVQDGWRVVQQVRVPIQFERVNLLDEDALQPAAYDLIFCRNLMIYLDSVSRLRLASNLSRALRLGGRLVLGAADWSNDLTQLYRMQGPAYAFSFAAVELPLQQEAETPQAVASVVECPAPIVFRQASEENVELLYERAADAFEKDASLAERLCRQVLYLQSDHLPALELLSRLWRTRASQRLNRALAARLRRRRTSIPEMA